MEKLFKKCSWADFEKFDNLFFRSTNLIFRALPEHYKNSNFDKEKHLHHNQIFEKTSQ